MGVPRIASVVAIGEWVCTIADTSGLLRYARQCSGVSDEGFRVPRTGWPDRSTTTMSAGPISSYGIEDGVMQMTSSLIRMLMLPEVWLSRPRASRWRPIAASWRLASAIWPGCRLGAGWLAGTGRHRPGEQHPSRPVVVDRLAVGDRQRDRPLVGGGLVCGVRDLQGPPAVPAEGRERGRVSRDGPDEVLEQLGRELGPARRDQVDLGGLARGGDPDGADGSAEVPGALVVDVGDVAVGPVDLEPGAALAPCDVDQSRSAAPHRERAVGVVIGAAAAEPHPRDDRFGGAGVKELGQVVGVHADVHDDAAAGDPRVVPPAGPVLLRAQPRLRSEPADLRRDDLADRAIGDEPAG